MLKTPFSPLFLAALDVKYWLTLALTLLLGACTSSPVKKSNLDILDQTRHPLYDHHWIMEGKISVKQGNKRNTAFIRWEQNHDQLRLTLTGPMGQGLTRIVSDEHQQAILIHKQKRTHYENLDRLFYEHLGWNFSVNQVKYWLTGRPYNEENTEEDAASLIDSALEVPTAGAPIDGEPLLFRQDRWNIKIREWVKLEESFFLAPRKISFNFPSNAINPELTLKLVIKKWIPTPSPSKHSP